MRLSNGYGATSISNSRLLGPMAKDLDTLKADASLVVSDPAVQDDQNQFFLAHGEYKQVIVKPASVVEGIVSYSIDIYTGKAGKGYIINQFVRKDALLYAKSDSVGPESRTTNWVVVPKSP